MAALAALPLFIPALAALAALVALAE